MFLYSLQRGMLEKMMYRLIKKKLLDFLPANCNLVLKKFCTEFRANSSQIEVKSSKMQKYDKNWKTVGLLRK